MEEGAMQGFIRHQVISILQPVTEEIQDIQAQLEHFRKDMALTDGQVAANKADVENTERDILALKVSDKDLQSQIDTVRLEATKDSEELIRTNQDLQANKAVLAELNSKSQRSRAAHEELQLKFEDMGNLVSALNKHFGQFDQVIWTHVRNFNQLKDDHNDLHGRHLEHGKKLEQAEQELGGTDRAFQKFLKEHRHQCEEDTQVLSNITKQVNGLSALVDDTRESLHNQGLGLQTVTSDFQLLTSKLNHSFPNSINQLEVKHAEMAANLQKTTEALTKTEYNVAELRTDVSCYRPGLQKTLQDLGIKAADNMNSVSELSKVVQRQGDVIADTTLRTDKASRNLKRLYEQQTASEQEIVSIRVVNKVTTEMLEAHAREHQRTRSDLTSLSRESDASLSQLRSDLGATGAMLRKLSNSFETCNHYIQGVGKGLQDVHNHTLMGEHNLIRPKSPRTITPLRKPRTPLPGTQR